MTTDSNNASRPNDPHADSIGVPGSPFDAAVFAAFGDRLPSGAATDDATVAQLRELLALMREAPLDRPSNALRACAERLFTERADLGSLVGAWLAAARQVVMDLVQPERSGSSEGGLVASLAGFRGAAAPISTFRAHIGGIDPNAPAMDAWLDLQLDPVGGGTRLRGQITCEHRDGDHGAIPLMLHLVDPTSHAAIANALIDEDGTFVLTTDARVVTLVVELEAGDTALVVRDVVLRS